MKLYDENCFNDYLSEYENILKQIQAQYCGTNIEELLKGIIEIKKKFFFNALLSLVNDNLFLWNAKGDCLDLWGVLLGINRYLPIKADSKNYNYFNFKDKNFDKLLFFNKNKPDYFRLDDFGFRKMLLFLLQKQFIFPSIKNTNNFLDKFFSDYGGLSISDTNDMSFITYYFSEEIPVWLNYFLTKRDVLPRPAGVGAIFKVESNYYFGFETDDEEWNETMLGNFYETNFVDWNEID
ncbi:DUF2612 domain-containing protein [Campylobacter sp.]|uniref:DUF2612 domain-containing protein n=1 Tax=Campylobacter sp. TaxID=205 RepID=UPI0025BA73C8|nr:DUF2612 domain-containing protein [Campylobacter sp.]